MERASVLFGFPRFAIRDRGFFGGKFGEEGSRDVVTR